ncbi:50S ribosomal protein L18 [Planctomycetota bacterium]|nr:50S ribosomal protein L18 [Planctomycetota bacterium]
MQRIKAKWHSIAIKKRRIRKTVEGLPSRPRLTVYRSEKHIYGQIIDDLAGKTLVATSTVAIDLAAAVKNLSPMDAAKKVGETIAEKAIAAGITKVVFDRNGRRYSGRLQALAESARAKGLQF